MSEPEPLASQTLHFPDGIPGFPEAERFALTDLSEDGNGAFQLLESLDEPDLSMVVTVPWLFFPDYAPEIDDVDRTELGLDKPEDAVVFCAVTMGDERDVVYVNLLGPFVVNGRTRMGRQVVLRDDSQPLRAPLPLAG
jgi:flagellar assembly factor FliW